MNFEDSSGVNFGDPENAIQFLDLARSHRTPGVFLQLVREESVLNRPLHHWDHGHLIDLVRNQEDQIAALWIVVKQLAAAVKTLSGENL